MTVLADIFAAIRDFMEAGGGVLWAIMAVTVVMWTLIIERAWYLLFVMPGQVSGACRRWQARADTTSWRARSIRAQIISGLSLDARRFLLMIHTLMTVLPLLGLLGTVTGMIRVFEIMAVMGTGNARAMAGGVSAATIPTMAGLVAALSGLYFASLLERRASRDVERAEDALAHRSPSGGNN